MLSESHLKALKHLMTYDVSMVDKGLVLFPDRVWDSSSELNLCVHGRLDFDCAANMDDRQTMSGGAVFLDGVSSHV